MINVNLNNNFWVDNPEILLLPEFKSLYDKDKSKQKEESAKLMSAMYFVSHPESTYFPLPNKYEIISDNFLKLPNFKWSNIEKELSLFKELVLTDAERALINWGEIMRMRDNTLKKLYKEALEVNVAEVDTKTLKDLDSMLTATPKMFEDYKKIKKDYEEEKTVKKGKHIKSLSDAGEI